MIRNWGRCCLRVVNNIGILVQRQSRNPLKELYLHVCSSTAVGREIYTVDITLQRFGCLLLRRCGGRSHRCCSVLYSLWNINPLLFVYLLILLCLCVYLLLLYSSNGPPHEFAYNSNLPSLSQRGNLSDQFLVLSAMKMLHTLPIDTQHGPPYNTNVCRVEQYSNHTTNLIENQLVSCLDSVAETDRCTTTTTTIVYTPPYYSHIS